MSQRCIAYLQLKHISCRCDDCSHADYLAILESRMLKAETPEEAQQWADYLKEHSNRPWRQIIRE